MQCIWSSPARGPCKVAHRRTPMRTALHFVLLSLALCFTLSATPAAGQQLFFTPQPAGFDSTLVDINKLQILDSTFASWIQGALIKNGQTNAQDAKFLFQECFGGGMLDDLPSALGTVVPWVGGSASRWDQEAWPTFDATNGAWSAALIPQLNNANQTVLTSINNARALSVQGINGLRREEGQSLVANGGQNITLRDVTAQSHHAILWVGDTTYSVDNPFRTAIGQMISTLRQAWQGSNFTIDVLFGDGVHDSRGGLLPVSWNARPATAANLQATITAVGSQMSPNEQFLFYGFDHGGLLAPVPPPPNQVYPILIPANQTVPLILLLTPDQLLGLLNNGLPPAPVLQVIFLAPAVGDVDVLFNGVQIGDFGPDAGDLEPDPMMSFDVPINLLQLRNTIEFINETPDTVQINNVIFGTGPVFPLPVIPEPSAWLTLGIGCLGMVVLTRRRLARRL